MPATRPRPPWWRPIEHWPSRLAVDVERAFLAELGGGCDLPVGAHATLRPGGEVALRAFLAGPGGTRGMGVVGPGGRSRLGPAGGSPGSESRRRLVAWPRCPLSATIEHETVELLQQLIRNACVNDGTPESGQEVRSADVLQGYLEGAGLDVEVFEPTPGRRSLVARIEGTDPTAPTLCLMGHTDVVPVSPAGWRRDPFGGELVDGEVWGRGAVDMLNLTASMAVATKHLALSGWQPAGTLVYLGVADEEAGGTHGAEWLVEPRVGRGGLRLRGDRERRVGHRRPRAAARWWSRVGEKGVSWRRLTVHGTPGHGSMPFGADNALVTAAEVVRRLATYRPAAVLDDIYRAYVASLDLTPEVQAALVAPGHDRCRPRRPPRRAGRQVRPRLHPHHDLAEHGPRRCEDERDPRRGGARGRHPHPARADRGARGCCARRRARAPGRRG